ncbi:MAG: hypothetical protein JSR60_20525 [Proteobacteria bacterium]|nr:hypothetical protein [Pseudomonadota bacterium]
MAAAVKLQYRDIKAVVDRIFDRLIGELGDEATVTIDAAKDYYWEVPYDGLYDVSTPPRDLDVGRLTDDWEFLSSIIADETQAVRPMLAHLSTLLRVIAEQ